MREIKFRAWGIKENKYLKLHSIHLSTSKVIVSYYGTGGGNNSIALKDVVLEQYTGLKDKNDKEIWEGDIVNLEYYEKPRGKKKWNKTYPPKGGKDINVVVFEDGVFKFSNIDKDGIGSELSFSDYGWWESCSKEYKYVAEVIGNIHENPELLEGEK